MKKVFLKLINNEVPRRKEQLSPLCVFECPDLPYVDICESDGCCPMPCEWDGYCAKDG